MATGGTANMDQGPGRNRPRIGRVIVALLTSFAFTAALFWGLALLIDRDGPLSETMAKQRLRAAKSKRNGRSGPRRLTAMISPRRVGKRLAKLGPRKELKKKKKKKKPEDKLKGQIVETARPKLEVAPKKTKYLGRYDMKVEKEQKSKGHKRKGRELGKVAIKDPSRIQSPTSKSKKKTRIAGGNRAAKAQKAKPKKVQQRGDAAILPGPKRTAKGSKLRKGAGAVPGGGSPLPRGVQPSVVRGKHADMILPGTSAGNIAHNIQALAGNPGSDDYLPDVKDEGATNLLNTRKFRYWDFFQRVRERVRSEWNPTRAWRSRDPTGRRYGVRDRLTVLRVRLQPNGTLKTTRVAKRSGLRFLDDEAQRAFSAAGPYPNPPQGLLNERGEVEFQFGFMFEISSSRFSFYRMQR